MEWTSASMGKARGNTWLDELIGWGAHGGAHVSFCFPNLHWVQQSVLYSVMISLDTNVKKKKVAKETKCAYVSSYTPLLQRRVLKDSSINFGFLMDDCIMSLLNSRVLFPVNCVVPATSCLINVGWMTHFWNSEAESRPYWVYWVPGSLSN